MFLHNAHTQYMACVFMLVPRKDVCLRECVCMYCITKIDDIQYVCEHGFLKAW